MQFLSKLGRVICGDCDDYVSEEAALNNIRWSEPLDATFKCNSKLDPSLTWQYFASSSGFMRLYPGTPTVSINALARQRRSENALFSSHAMVERGVRPDVRLQDQVVVHGGHDLAEGPVHPRGQVGLDEGHQEDHFLQHSAHHTRHVDRQRLRQRLHFQQQNRASRRLLQQHAGAGGWVTPTARGFYPLPVRGFRQTRRTCDCCAKVFRSTTTRSPATSTWGSKSPSIY